MNRFVAVRLGAVVCIAILLALFPAGRGAGQSREMASSGTVSVEPIHELRKGVDAWPLIVSPNDVAAQRVNAVLTELNLKLAKSLTDCDANYIASAKAEGFELKGKDSAANDWERKIQVTMTGPRFLSIVATDDFVFCGGNHPDSDRNAMVFDLSSGSLVDWGKLIAKSAGASSELGSGGKGGIAPLVFFPALEKINLEAADKDCKDAFRNAQPFLIWPDARRGALVIQAGDMFHAVQACADEIPLTMEQARQLGFDEDLLSAIKDAHRRIKPPPKR